MCHACYHLNSFAHAVSLTGNTLPLSPPQYTIYLPLMPNSNPTLSIEFSPTTADLSGLSFPWIGNKANVNGIEIHLLENDVFLRSPSFSTFTTSDIPDNFN